MKAMSDLGSGGSDHHAVMTIFEVDTAGNRGVEEFHDSKGWARFASICKHMQELKLAVELRVFVVSTQPKRVAIR